MTAPTSGRVQRLVFRMTANAKDGSVVQILEQEILGVAPNIQLALRRSHFRNAVSHALLNGGTIKIEARKLNV